MEEIVNPKTAVALPKMVPKELWEEEFMCKQSIPSSVRREPAKALQLFTELLQIGGSLKVLDAGCGNGRNAVYLAKRGCYVTAVDFADSAIMMTQKRSTEEGLRDKVSVVQHVLNQPSPLASASFDFILDAYTFCHFIQRDIAVGFWSEMERVARPGAHLLSIVFSRDDEYYASFLRDSPDGLTVCDPTNGICKRLYSEGEIKGFFESLFDLQYFARFEFSDVVFGTTYRRVVITSVLQKRVA